jgi:hypothetical protein
MLRWDHQHQHEARSAAGGWGCPSISVPPIVLLPSLLQIQDLMWSCPASQHRAGRARRHWGGIYLPSPSPADHTDNLCVLHLLSGSFMAARDGTSRERKGLSSVPISPHSGWLGLRDRIEIYLYVPVEKWLNGASFEALAPQRERHREDAVEMPLAARLPLGTGMHAVRRQIIAASACRARCPDW